MKLNSLVNSSVKQRAKDGAPPRRRKMQDKMTKLDWVKVVLGTLIAVPIWYAMMVIIMVL